MIDIGSKINGRYKVIGSIGSGGMANVFLAHDLILDRDVAVKVLRFDFQNDQSAIRRFQREALASSELVHPNIVSVYDVGEEDGMQYLVMEYVRGTDLKKFIVNHYPIPFESIVIIMRQILSAISLAHQHRIIHRDMKPQNILMDEEGNVKIADFGIAIALSETSLTQTNTLLGSVHYLSPEQARGSMATRQSDIYALGVILYELLTGSVPFEGESAVSIALKHFQSEMPSVRDFNPDIPQALENVVLHATAKEAADRYVSADEMAQDIATSLSPDRFDEPVYAPQAMFEETKVLTPLTESDMPEAFAEMPQQTPEPPTYNGDNYSNGPKGKKSRKKLWISLGVLGAIVVGVLIFLAYFRPSEITVPDVADKTVDEARLILEEKELVVDTEIKEIPDEKIDEGKVVKTSPTARSKVKKNSTITLYVSSGSKKITLKDYTGKNIDDVRLELQELGFSGDKYTIKKVESDEVEENLIISHDPSSGAQVDPEKDTINFVVSLGKGSFALRDMSSYRQIDVQTYFEEKGLLPVFEEEYSDTVSAGLVIRSNPSFGTEVAEGQTITLFMSLGKKPVESTTPPSSSSTPPSSSSSSSSSSSTITTTTGSEVDDKVK